VLIYGRRICDARFDGLRSAMRERDQDAALDNARRAQAAVDGLRSAAGRVELLARALAIAVDAQERRSRLTSAPRRPVKRPWHSSHSASSSRSSNHRGSGNFKWRR
jgi:hypothetical protein